MAEEYTHRLFELTNKGCVAITLSLAKEIGILDVLKTASQPLTSLEIAAQKNLKERYVREALGALSAARLVHVATNSRGQNVYHLTDDEKTCLDSSNMAWPYIGVPGFMSSLYRQGLKCFEAEGPYGFHYGPEVHNVMEGFNVADVDNCIESFFTHIPGLKDKLEYGIDVAEFGCGRGVIVATLADRFPKSRFTASEYSEENVEILRSKHGHLSNLTFARHDLCETKTDENEQYDWIFINDVIHDLPQPQAALEKLRKLTKKDGGVCCLREPSLTETGNPEEAVGDETIAAYYSMSVFTCIPEGYENDQCAALGCVYGKQLMKDMAIKTGFSQVKRIEVNPEYSLYICSY